VVVCSWGSCLPTRIRAHLCPSTQHPLQERATNTLREGSPMQLAEVFTLVSTSDSMAEHGTTFSFLQLVQCHSPNLCNHRLTHAPSPSPGALETPGCWAAAQLCAPGISTRSRNPQKVSGRSCGTTDEGRQGTLGAFGPRLSSVPATKTTWKQLHRTAQAVPAARCRGWMNFQQSVLKDTEFSV